MPPNGFAVQFKRIARIRPRYVRPRLPKGLCQDLVRRGAFPFQESQNRVLLNKLTVLAKTGKVRAW
jgi:hypothetical protein